MNTVNIALQTNDVSTYVDHVSFTNQVTSLTCIAVSSDASLASSSSVAQSTAAAAAAATVDESPLSVTAAGTDFGVTAVRISNDPNHFLSGNLVALVMCFHSPVT
jgi:hypothetical protein